MKTKAIMIMSWAELGSCINLRIIPSPDRARRTARPLDRDEWKQWRDVCREVSDSMSGPLLAVVFVPSDVDKQAINVTFKGGTPLGRDEVESFIARFQLAFETSKMPVEVSASRLFDEALRHNLWPDPIPPIGEHDKVEVFAVSGKGKPVKIEPDVKKVAIEAKDEPATRPARPHPTEVLQALRVLQDAQVSVLMGFEIVADSGLSLRQRYSQSFIIDNDIVSKK